MLSRPIWAEVGYRPAGPISAWAHALKKECSKALKRLVSMNTDAVFGSVCSCRTVCTCIAV